MSATLTVRKTSCRGAQRLHALPPICHVTSPSCNAPFPFTELAAPYSSYAIAPLHSSSIATFWDGASAFLRLRNVPGQRWAIVVLEWLSSPRCAPRPVVSSDANSVASLSSLDTVHKLDSLMEVIRPRWSWFRHGTNSSRRTVGFAVYPRKHFWVTISWLYNNVVTGI